MQKRRMYPYSFHIILSQNLWLSCSQLGPYPNYTQMEIVPPKFIRAAFQAPKCIPNTIWRFEVGQMRIEVRAWLLIFNYLLKCHYFPAGLIPSIFFQMNLNPVEIQAIGIRISSILWLFPWLSISSSLH